MTDTGLESGPRSSDTSVEQFVQQNNAYYSRHFAKIQGTTGFAFSWNTCLLYTSPSPRDRTRSRMPSSA